MSSARSTHLWSLSIEEHFYVVWPLIVVGLGRRRLLRVCICAAVIVMVARYAYQYDQYAYRGTHLRVDAMLVGAGLAVGMKRFVRPSRHLVVLSAVVVALFCGASMHQPGIAWGYAVLAVAAAVLLADAAHWREVRWLARAGLLSYGLYLYHLPIQFVLATYGLQDGRLFLATLVLTWGLAEMSYRTIEAAFRRRPAPLDSPAATATSPSNEPHFT